MTADSAEYCWFCDGPLCYPCWETYGHCGHADADLANHLAGQAQTWDERDAVLRLFRPDLEPLAHG